MTHDWTMILQTLYSDAQIESADQVSCQINFTVDNSALVFWFMTTNIVREKYYKKKRRFFYDGPAHDSVLSSLVTTTLLHEDHAHLRGETALMMESESASPAAHAATSQTGSL